MTMRIDAHQHFWNPTRGDYGWLTPELTTLYRTFGPADLQPLLETAGFQGCVAVQAAPSVLWRARVVAQPSGFQRWARTTQQRRGHNIAAVAVANKLARIAWAVWSTQRPFTAEGPPPARDCTDAELTGGLHRARGTPVGPARGYADSRFGPRGRLLVS